MDRRTIRHQSLPRLNIPTEASSRRTWRPGPPVARPPRPDEPTGGRWDHPPVQVARRGAKRKGLEIADCPHDLAQARDNYDRDKHARTAVKTREGLLQTWCSFHNRAHGEGIPALPLTPEKIATVASIFKAAQYRAYGNYLARIKEEHVTSGYPWTEALQYEAKASLRSVTRGQGPSKQSQPFPLGKLTDRDLGIRALSKGGPMNPSAVIVLGCFFLLREIEASALTWADV
eukprot:5432023-Amphidinium_carterae.1